MKARVIHPPIYGASAVAVALDDFEAGSVLMINPCRVKGIGIFADLAARFPDISVFGADRLGNHHRGQGAARHAAQRSPAGKRSRHQRRSVGRRACC